MYRIRFSSVKNKSRSLFRLVCLSLLVLLGGCVKSVDVEPSTPQQDASKREFAQKVINLGRDNIYLGFSADIFPSSQYAAGSHNKKACWTDCWDHAGAIIQVDGSLELIDQERFEIVLTIQNRGNNPFYCLGLPIERQHKPGGDVELEFILTDGAIRFSPKQYDVVSACREVGTEKTPPIAKLYTQTGEHLPFIILSPSQGTRDSFLDNYRKEVPITDTCGYGNHFLQQCVKHEHPVAILRISHPDFKIPKIEKWKNLLLCVYMNFYFTINPLSVEPNPTLYEMVFNVPDFNQAFQATLIKEDSAL